MQNIYFHDLVVYRLSGEKYRNEEDALIDAFVDGARGPNTATEVLKSIRSDIKQHRYNKFGMWRFNEATGYVRLHFLGSQVRGEYYAVKRTRVARSRTKTFVYRTHKLAPERDVRPKASNREILDVILKYVQDCRAQERRRHFDSSWLTTIGPFIDWNAVMGRR